MQWQILATNNETNNVIIPGLRLGSKTDHSTLVKQIKSDRRSRDIYSSRTAEVNNTKSLASYRFA